MAAGPASWEELTPNELKSAIKHIRDEFEHGLWRWSEVTEKLCYAALHPDANKATNLAPYQRALVNLRHTVNPMMLQHLDDQLRTGTPSAIFHVYFELYRYAWEINVDEHFEAILQIAVGKQSIMNAYPVEWARAQLELLIKTNEHKPRSWVKRVCDERDGVLTPGIDERPDEWIFWRKWRAPKLIHMQPSGNTFYDPRNAWTREDEISTNRFLEGLSKRFIQFIEIHLEEIAGKTHVRLAINRPDTLGRPSQRLEDVQMPDRHAKSDSGMNVRDVSAMIRDPSRYPTMTVDEAARALDLSRATVYRMLEDGRLKRASLGARYGTRRAARVTTKSVVAAFEPER